MQNSSYTPTLFANIQANCYINAGTQIVRHMYELCQANNIKKDELLTISITPDDWINTRNVIQDALDKRTVDFLQAAMNAEITRVMQLITFAVTEDSIGQLENAKAEPFETKLLQLFPNNGDLFDNKNSIEVIYKLCNSIYQREQILKKAKSQINTGMREYQDVGEVVFPFFNNKIVWLNILNGEKLGGQPFIISALINNQKDRDDFLTAHVVDYTVCAYVINSGYHWICALASGPGEFVIISDDRFVTDQPLSNFIDTFTDLTGFYIVMTRLPNVVYVAKPVVVTAPKVSPACVGCSPLTAMGLFAAGAATMYTISK